MKKYTEASSVKVPGMNLWMPEGKPSDARDYTCEWRTGEGRSTHYVHAQTGRPVLNVAKLKRIVADDTVDNEKRLLFARKLSILSDDGFACVKCGEKECLTIDHVNGIKICSDNYQDRLRLKREARSHAAGYDPFETQTLCIWCHGDKDGWWR